jgi:hypothetical protein
MTGRDSYIVWLKLEILIQLNSYDDVAKTLKLVCLSILFEFPPLLLTGLLTWLFIFHYFMQHSYDIRQRNIRNNTEGIPFEDHYEKFANNSNKMNVSFAFSLQWINPNLRDLSPRAPSAECRVLPNLQSFPFPWIGIIMVYAKHRKRPMTTS